MGANTNAAAALCGGFSGCIIQTHGLIADDLIADDLITERKSTVTLTKNRGRVAVPLW